MHKAFQKHVRPDGLGVDYNKVDTFDVRGVVKQFFTDQTAGVETNLKRALQTKSKNELRSTIAAAERIGLHANTSSLLKEAQIALYGAPVLY